MPASTADHFVISSPRLRGEGGSSRFDRVDVRFLHTLFFGEADEKAQSHTPISEGDALGR